MFYNSLIINIVDFRIYFRVGLKVGYLDIIVLVVFVNLLMKWKNYYDVFLSDVFVNLLSICFYFCDILKKIDFFYCMIFCFVKL